MRPWKREATSGVPSVEPSSTTTTWTAGWVWPRQLSIAAPRKRAWLYAGMMMETQVIGLGSKASMAHAEPGADDKRAQFVPGWGVELFELGGVQGSPQQSRGGPAARGAQLRAAHGGQDQRDRRVNQMPEGKI